MASKVLKARNSSSSTTQAMKKSKKGADAGKTVEEIYQKKTQLEHILLRPDTYIGSVESNTKNLFVVDPEAGFVQREITYVPGLYKIFDEIIVNAADNKIRDPTMDCIKVTIDKAKAEISVYNTGKGIPVQVHAKEGVYVPELIFGHLLTSSNYDDNQKKVTGGRNGYGAKLCNIFSTKFVVETCDTETGKKYRQVFRDNMAIKEDPVIVKTKSSDKDFTRITFRPDLSKFHMSELDDDIIALMARRVYDVAGTTRGIKVYLNNERLPVRHFKDYVNLVLRDQNVDTKVVHEVVNDRWEVCMTLSENGFQQMSFVNSIATTKGGTHVNYVADQIVSGLLSTIKRKNKGAAVKPHQVKNHMWLFINCLIENPSFDSQTKENMTRRSKDFGSNPVLSDKFLKNIKDTGIVDAVLNWAKLKSQAQLSKASSGSKKCKISGIPKLDDANEAGGRNSSKCTLILTEGDSAKALAVSGLGVLGRDYYGVFPLRGKLLNVREASHKQIMDNAEVKNIAKIMGLKFGHEYTTTKQLRYGRLMIMTDQDQDGSHIKGLLINFIHHFWPSLLKMPDFLVEFVTPIVKCTKGKQEVSFFTIPQYETWAEQQGNLKGWRIKYYKGLGTSTPQEAKEYFSHMDDHQIPFSYEGDKDFEDIVMAFSKKHVEARKQWLKNFVPGTYLDHATDAICYSDFINKELILFSMADNVRSIPSIMDGLKPGQRKVLFSCFKRKLKDEIKVAQLAGYVSEHSAYHHGEMSLAGTIVGMAQRFVGSNNLNLLLPIGQFGTRLAGGKDAASSRYIFTSLSPLARKIFHLADDALLNHLEDDGQTIEPEFYAPILPMVLVNGSDGIGTGWSSSVPNYNPRDLVNALIAMIEGQEPDELHPWYAGFTGEITPKGKDKYAVRGTLKKLDETTIEISELPIRTWTQPYKEFLEGLAADDGKKPPQILEFSQYHTDTTVRFVVSMTPEQMQAAETKGLYKVFKLEGSISTSNMTLFDPQGRIKKYEGVQEILRDFFDVRLRLYQKRKSLLADCMTSEYKKMDNKVRFILDVISGSLVISNRKKADILQELRAKGFAAFPKPKGKKGAKTVGDLDDDAAGAPPSSDEDEALEESASDFDYLLSMPMWNLTMERVDKLTEERNGTEAELNALLEKTPQDLWKEDLTAFVEALAEIEAAEEEQELNMSQVIEKNLKKSKAKRKTTRKKKATAAAKKSKKQAVKAEAMDDDNDDDDFAGDDAYAFTGGDDDDWMPPGGVTTAPKTKKGAAKAKKSTRQLDIKESLSNGGAKTTKRSMRTAAKVAQKRTQKMEEEVDDEDVDDEVEWDMPAAQSKSSSDTSSNSIALDGDDDDDDEEFKGGLFARLQTRRRNVAASPDETVSVSSSSRSSTSSKASSTNGGRRGAAKRGAAKRTFDESRSPSPAGGEEDEDFVLDVSDDEEGENDAGDDSDWEAPALASKAKGKKKAAATAKASRGAKAAKKTTAAAKKTTKAATTAKRKAAAKKSSTKAKAAEDEDDLDTSVFDFGADGSVSNDDDNNNADDDDFSVASLTSRRGRGAAAAKGKKAKAAPAAKRGQRKTKAAIVDAVISDDSDDDDEAVVVAAKAKKTTATRGKKAAGTKTKAATKTTKARRTGRKVIADDDDDDDIDADGGMDDSWMPDSPAAPKAKGNKKAKKAAPVKKVKKATTTAKRSSRRVLSDDDDGADEDNSTGGRSRRPRRTRKKVDYAAMMESDDEANGAAQNDGANEDEQEVMDFKDDDSDFDAADESDSEFEL
ncbi:DNA topoisomerase II, variant [Salpingoeca rosetta]|uniref:DNA topoisomerase 2 n=1 Tax=Salpingoeca rosetta (strain ATCC 50818 / BSB-021) TaxID=946362 RepID=F2U845_SALR5|nr:DNA topoisomerase II, variant [Salpingoeca rosetta]EGD72949.1 DNA topoisomerase II, variant [Salpingoeca rosetta]|eukprot:XP_004994771.1 DNA topoisomerase II, variant [Salpingoeca rosetta]